MAFLDFLFPKGHHYGRTRYSAGTMRGKYSFVSKLTGNRLPSTSKYMPHQGKREIARRQRQMT